MSSLSNPKGLNNFMEEVCSKSGDRILKIGDHLLCSQIDPVREAQRWVDGHQEIVNSGVSVIVLGLGAGYHVAHLRRRFPNLSFMVFESNMRCIQFSERLFPIELFEIPIFGPEDSSSFMRDQQVQKVLSGKYKLISHLPSMSLNRHWYDEIKGNLLGRSTDGLHYHLKLVTGLDRLDANKELWPEGEPVSWKLFDRLSQKDFEEIGDREFFIMKALRELIR